MGLGDNMDSPPDEVKARPRGHTGGKVRTKTDKKGHKRSASDARKEWKKKQTEFMCEELAKFLTHILDKDVSPKFVMSLRTGIELCDLIEKVTKGRMKVKKVHRKIGDTAMHKARYTDNLHHFCQACRDCGIEQQDLCGKTDFDGKGNLEPILNNLYALLGIALRNGIDIPESLVSKVKEKNIAPPSNIVEDDDDDEDEDMEEKEEETILIKVKVAGWFDEQRGPGVAGGGGGSDEIGGFVEVEVRRSDPVIAIKEQVYETTKIPVEKQYLYHQDNPLDDEDTIEEAGLDEGSSVSMYIKSEKDKNSFLTKLLPTLALLGMSISIIAMLGLFYALFFATWAVAYGNDGSAVLEFMLLGYYQEQNFTWYEAGLGFDAVTTGLSSVGGVVFGLLAFALLVTMPAIYLFFKNYQALSSDEDDGHEEGHDANEEEEQQQGEEQQGEEQEQEEGEEEEEEYEGETETWFSYKRSLEWLLDHSFLLPITGGCCLVVSVVVYSYLASPKAYAYGRYVQETNTLEFGSGSAFVLCLVVCALELMCASLMHVIRFQGLVNRLDKSSRETKKISTYGSIEIVLEPSFSEKPSWGCC